jgi:transposase-like protein
MSVGRPTDGWRHVDRLSGPEGSKQRLKLILGTLSGAVSVVEACERLGLSEARLHELRHAALEGALRAIVPGSPGRPGRVATEAEVRVEALEAEVEALREELQIALVRTELAVAMPQRYGGKKKSVEPKVRRRPRL